ncbi:MAG TPA: MarR family transcriptional regulator [Trichocoleus sp.]
MTAHTRLLEQMEADLSEADLPPMDWYDVLYTLKEAPNYRLRLSELAEKVLLSRSNLTRLVDRLERAGLIRRESCPSDRRGTYAVLTEAGLAMQQKMWQIYGASIASEFAAHIEEDEAQVLQQVFERLLAAAAAKKQR